MSRPRLVLLTSVAASLRWLLVGQPRFLAQHFEVTLMTSPGGLDGIAEREGVSIETVPMPRRIDPFTDLSALVALVRRLRARSPDIVQTYTPKAGLIGMLAARAAGVPVRVHGIVGMPLMEARGARRAVLNATERLTYAAATHLTCNSFGLRDWVNAHLTPEPITVVGHGSINGIDTMQWTRDPQLRVRTREALGFGPHDLVVGFVGRLVRDKGVVELVEAFARWRGRDPHRRLLLVGGEEPTLDPLPDATRRALSHPAITRVGFSSDVRRYLAAADIFALPSYREGLPNALLEAGAMGLPAVASDINGCNEVIVDGVTGCLVPAKQIEPLCDALERLSRPEARASMGDAARRRVVARYDQRRFHQALLASYRDQILALDRSAPSREPRVGPLSPRGARLVP